MVFYEVANKMSVRAASSESLTRTEGVTSKVAHSCGGQTGLLAGRKPPPQGCVTALTTWWLTFPKVSKPTSQKQCSNILFDLQSAKSYSITFAIVNGSLWDQ